MVMWVLIASWLVNIYLGFKTLLDAVLAMRLQACAVSVSF